MRYRLRSPALLVGRSQLRSAPLFGLFKSPPFHDPKLGELVRSRGLWRGLLTIEAGVSAPLTLSGTRTEPHAQPLAAAGEVAQAFASWRPAILIDHHPLRNAKWSSTARVAAISGPYPLGILGAKIFLGYLSYIENRVWPGQPVPRLPPPGGPLPSGDSAPPHSAKHSATFSLSGKC